MVVVVVSLLGTVSGCGQSHELETADVQGIVTLDGRPVHSGSVIFTPPRGRAAKGVIGPDGTFSLSTYAAGDGAILGVHQVTIVAREKGSGGSEGRPGKSLIPERYGSPTVSGLSFEVKADGPNVANFELTSN